MHILADLRSALRTLKRTPGFAVACILTLAIGIGANTALFSVIDGVLLRPLPYQHPEDLYVVAEQGRDGAQRLPSYPNFADYQGERGAFAGFGYILGVAEPWRTAQGVKNIPLARVSDGFFQLLGARPLLGRTLLPEDERTGTIQAGVISHGFWRSQFAGDPGVIGQTIPLGDGAVTIVGVLPPGVGYPSWAQLYIPIAAGTPPPAMQQRNMHVDGGMIARLTPGSDRAGAEAQLASLNRRLAESYPAENAGFSATLLPLRSTVVDGNIQTPLLLLLAATAMVLLIACVNVANLFLARLSRRTHELALRSALGADRGRLVTQLLAEAALIAVGGAVIGLWCADALIRLLVSGAPVIASTVGTLVPRLDELHMDGRVFGLAAVLTVLSALGAGLAPAWSGSRADLAGLLKQGGSKGATGTGRRGRRLLIAVQTGLALALLVASGLLLSSFWHVTRVQPGFESAGLLSAHLFPSPQYRAPTSNLPELYQRLTEAAAAVPGVQGVGLVNHLPMGGSWNGTRVSVDGAPFEDGRELTVGIRSVNQSYLSVMQIPLVKGRWFAPGDMRESVSGIVINQAMADRYWPTADPIGHRVDFFKSAAGRADFGQPVSGEIIGVVGDVRQFGLEQNSDAAIYVPFTAAAWGHTSLLVRTGGEPSQLAEPLRRALLAADPDIVIDAMSPMREVVSGTFAARGFMLTLLGFFALTALLLAAIGLYGVLSHLVGERTREIGIRRAIGADEGRIVREVVGDGLAAVGWGIAGGLLLAWGMGRLMTSQLFGVTPTDPLTCLVTVVLLLLTAMAASYGPARRAARVDPMTELRGE
jgi:putative ABC transport system permease protein